MTTQIQPKHLRPNITRVRDSSGFVGTIVYVGPVASAKSDTEIYAGIVWDDVTRGIHDGSVICRITNQIVRHFKCGVTQGSFLRLSKIDVGVALTPEVMRSRYVKPDAALIAPDNLLQHVARTAGGRDKPIEFWGEMKIRKRQQLETVEEISLRMLGIARPCSTEQESEMEEFRHLKSIDLAGNLLSDWDDVLVIMRQFNNLETLSLASNRINDPTPTSFDGLSISGITSLNLNSTNITTFRTLQIIGNAMPNLKELCVAHADLADLGSDTNYYDAVRTFQNLTLLDLTDCNLTSWVKQVLHLQNFPKLESLILNDNAIDHISFTESETSPFSVLASLQLAGTSLSSWSAIDNLNTVTSLRSLRLRNTPLTSNMGVGEFRSMVIARLPNLEMFNASPISERERTEAERRYVSYVSRELFMASSFSTSMALDGSFSNFDEKRNERLCDEDIDYTKHKENIHARHPQFHLLLEKHKDTMMSSLSNHGQSVGMKNMREDIIGITIRSMAASSCDMEPLRKRIPASLKVGRIKAMCAKEFGLEIDLQILHFSIENDPFPTELDDTEHTLAYYGVSDGAEILMNEIDLEAKEREKARQSADFLRLVKEQEQRVAVIQSVQNKKNRM